MNDLRIKQIRDFNLGLPNPTTEADDGKILFYDNDTNQWITDDAVTHGTSVINCKKSTAGTIIKGLPVYLVGFDSDLHTVELANATSSATMPVIGFTAEQLDDTNSKHIITFGKLTGIDTTSTVSTLNPNGETWAVNDALYMSTTTGGLTKTRPTGGTTQIQRIAKVLKVDSSGGQLFIFNTARTAGLPNLSTDKLWIGDANGIPQEVDKSTLNNFANTDLTLTGTRTHDLDGNILNINNGATTYFRINEFGDVLARGKGDTTNTHFGLNILRNNSSGVQNTVYGQDINGITSGQVNSYFGYRAGQNNNGTGNSFFGGFAGNTLTTGNNNIIIGRSAAFLTNSGGAVTNLENSIVIGETSRVLNSGDSNTIIIGRNSRGYGSNSAVLGGSLITLTRLRGRVEMDEITSGPTITDNNSYAIWFNSNVPTIRLKDSGGLETDIPLGGSQTGLISVNDSNGVPTFYTDLQTAINATADIDTIYIHSDIQVTSQISIPNMTSLTIEMNGHRIWYDTTSGDFNLFRFASSGGAGTDRIFTLKGGGILEQVGTISSATNAAVIHFFQVSTQRQLQIFAGTTLIKAENAHSIFNQANLRLIDGGVWYSTNGTISLNTSTASIRNANIDIYTSTGQFSGTYDNCHLNTRYGPFWITGSIINSRITGAILQTGTNVGMIICSGNDTISNNVILNGTGALTWAINCYYGGSSGRIDNNYIYSANAGIYCRYGGASNNYIYSATGNAIRKTSLGANTLIKNVCITNSTGAEAIYTTGGAGVIDNYCLCLNASNGSSAIRCDGANEQIIGNTAIVNNAAVANINLVGNVYLLNNVLGSIGTGIGGAGTNLQTNTADAFGNIKIG